MKTSSRLRTLVGTAVRTLLGSAAVLAIALAPSGSEPRWQKTIDILIALALLAATLTDTRHWKRLRVAVGGVAALLLAVSGTVAGVSLDEGFGLIAAAFLLSGGAWVLGLPEQRAAERREEATLTTLRAVQAELAALRDALSPPPARPGS
jgi:hypothetical protein